MSSNNNENLIFRIQVLESDNLLYKNIIKDKDKHIRNLRTRLRRANLDLKKLQEAKLVQMSIYDYEKV